MGLNKTKMIKLFNKIMQFCKFHKLLYKLFQNIF